MKMIETTVLKPHMGPNGVIVQRGATITVDETRHRQLVRKGYVPKPDGEGDEGLTNTNFTARRQTIVGGSEQNSQPAAPQAATPKTKAKVAKGKPAAPQVASAQSEQSTEGAGQS